ncbi:metallophosphoesterase family protein [Salinimicrobium sp. TH3]|uniref:metallophosphoesterase family protein n=1 Tax=Salinimicrobium sp. TH3 TaxID=2997342 RepID=UPI002276C705|nr:metallophosphoesterase family protein [Salinimicrobium sp. TH3]MCY2685958.1 metallophosphoesterase family protein [Salinimicrobium sp. TH3]
MKIALFSDIHANLPALEAFFIDVEKRDIDFIYCLGDLVGYNIWPNEVIEELRKRNISVIAGNYDYGIGRNSDDCGCAYSTDEEKANGAVSISLTNELISEKNRAYLRSLPAHMSVEFKMNRGNLNLLMVHGSPRKINEYLFEDREEKSLLRILEKAGADIMCFGHTHKPYHRILNSGEEENPHYRHAINLGSVGKPKDKDNRGGYVILEIDENSSIKKAESIKADFIRFSYDVEKAAKAVEDSRLPNAYAENLRRGY